MIVIDGSALQIVGGILLLAGLFVLREFASGALRHAGEDFWDRIKARRKSNQPESHLDPELAPSATPLCEETDPGKAMSRPPTPLRSESETPRKTA